MEANTTAAPPKGQTIAQVLRALKPFLPEGYSKLTSDRRAAVGYAYGERLSVEVYGVCSWNASTQEKEGCHAVSIKVTPGYAYRRYVGNSALGLRTTSHKPLKDGTFKLDTVGARIQFCLAQIKAMDEAKKREEEQRKSDAEASKALAAEVKAYVEREGFNVVMLDRYAEAPLFARKVRAGETEDEAGDDEERVTTGPRGSIRNGPKLVSIDFKGLTLDQLVRILRALKPVEVRTQPVRTRRRRSRS